MAISQHGTSVLFTSRPKDGLVVNLYIPHNRRTPLQAEEALGPISIHRVSRGVIYIYNINKFKSNNIFKKLYIYSDMNKFLYINHRIIYLYIMHFLLCIYTKMCIARNHGWLVLVCHWNRLVYILLNFLNFIYQQYYYSYFFCCFVEIKNTLVEPFFNCLFTFTMECGAYSNNAISSRSCFTK